MAEKRAHNQNRFLLETQDSRSNEHFNNNNKLDGIVEADETYFNKSQNGNKHIKNRNGVATKYLDKYVNYFREFSDKIDTFNQLLQLQGCYGVCYIKRRRVWLDSMWNL